MHWLTRLTRPVLLLVLLAASPAMAVEPARIFCDRMVLQRDVPVPVWGRAERGETVTVTFAGHSARATADARGLWHARLAAMPASAQPRTMTVKGKGDAFTIKDVLVGDVWLFSGDVIGLGYYHGRFLKKSRMGIYYDIRPFIEQDKAAERLPIIRVYSPAVPRGHGRHAVRRQYRFNTDGKAKWAAYDVKSWSGFGAIPYFFGREYCKRVKVPVAMIAIGTDDLASMAPPEGFAATPTTQDLAKVVGDWDPATSAGRAAHVKKLDELEKWIASTRRALAARSTDPDDFSHTPRMPGPPQRAMAQTTYYNNAVGPLAPYAVRGLILKTLQQNQYDPRYVDKAEALIRGLRIVLGTPKAPAAFFQFRPPMYWEERAAEDQSVWMRFREVQQGVARVPATSVLPAHDYVNDPRDPRNWAERASRWAIATVENQALRTGPVYASHRVAGREVAVTFTQVGRGLLVGDKKLGEPVKPAQGAALGGFELAGADGKWHAATAKIAGPRVVVTSMDVPKPAAVRYAWAPRPKGANLYNQAGFPAAPFHMGTREAGSDGDRPKKP